MEYFVILIDSKPIKVTETLLEALLLVKEYPYQVLIHRIHTRDGQLVVQEIITQQIRAQ